MKVKLNTNIAGPAFTGYVGDIKEVDPAFGKSLIDGGYAREFKVAPSVETAQSPGPGQAEKAVIVPKPPKPPKPAKGESGK